MKKIFTLFMALTLLALAGCSGANRIGQQLAGSWEGSLGPFEFKAMEFTPSESDPLKGKVNLAGQSLLKGDYEIVPGGRGGPDKLRITYSVAMFSTSRTYDFTVTKDTLTLTAEGGGTSLNYTRKAAAAGTTS